MAYLNRIFISLTLLLITQHTLSASVDPYAIVNPDPNHEINSETNQYCKQKDICKPFSFSRCVPKKVANNLELFECICEGPDFLKLEHTKFQGSQRLRMQTCSPKDLCAEEKYKCADPTASCHYTVVDTGKEITPLTYCTCHSNGKPDATLANRNLLCKQTCNEKCKNFDSCATDDRASGANSTTICHCKDGWTGPLCETEVKVEAKSTTGYVVAIVVLSIVAVLALIGVGVLVMKGRR